MATQAVIVSNGKYLVDRATNKKIGHRINHVSSNHNWQDIGKISGKQYQCKDCDAYLTDEGGYYSYSPGYEGICN